MSDGFEVLEQDIRRRLAELDQRYRAEAKPLIDILVQIQSTKSTAPVTLTQAQLHAWESDVKKWQG